MNRSEQGSYNRMLGRWGEATAAEWLRKRGWTVLAAGFHCRHGEIDLIAADRRYLAFVEVKLRKSDDFGTAGGAVDFRKQQRLRTTAEVYLAQYPTDLQPRFDVIEIYTPQGMETKKPKIVHLENAF